jgi:hypothetical protein
MLYFFSSLGLNKDVQASGEAFSCQNRTFSTSKMKILHFFLDHFCPLGAGTGSRATRLEYTSVIYRCLVFSHVRA